MGSGLLIRNAIKKHGVHNFEREILFEFDSREEAFLKETELLTIDLVTNPLCYNLIVGNDPRNIPKKQRDLYVLDPPPLTIPIDRRFNPEIRYEFVPVPENIKKWNDSIPKQLNNRSHRITKYITELTIKNFNQILQNLELCYNKKSEHNLVQRVIGTMERKNIRDCFEIVEKAW